MASITRTVAASGADHTTIAAAISYIDNNWTGYAGSDIATIQLIGAEEYNESNLNLTLPTAGGTPSATSYLKIEATDAVKHDGTYNTSKARVRGTTNGQHVFTITDNYVHMKNLAIMQDSTGNSDECIRIASGATNALIEKCVLYIDNDIADQDCIHASHYNAGPIYIYDCIFKLSGANNRAAICSQLYLAASAFTHTWNIEHCTADCNGADDTTDDGEGGISGWAENASSVVNFNIYNTACMDVGTNVNCFNEADQTVGSPTFAGTINWSGAGNIASDTSAESKFTSSFDSVTLRASDASGEQFYVTSLTAGSEDYQLIDGATGTDVALAAAQSGATRDSRCDTTVDIAGQPRPLYASGDRDIGALQLTGANTSEFGGAGRGIMRGVMRGVG